jgi:hypothetical protein
MQLVMADIDRKHMRGTALDQHLGEAAGRGADIERHAVCRIEAERLRARRSASVPRARHRPAPDRSA